VVEAAWTAPTGARLSTTRVDFAAVTLAHYPYPWRTEMKAGIQTQAMLNSLRALAMTNSGHKKSQ